LTYAASNPFTKLPTNCVGATVSGSGAAPIDFMGAVFDFRIPTSIPHPLRGINNKTPPTTANTPATAVVKKIPQNVAPRSAAVECMKWCANKCPYPSATNKTQAPLTTRKPFIVTSARQLRKSGQLASLPAPQSATKFTLSSLFLKRAFYSRGEYDAPSLYRLPD
jgi:hypothetical protein